MSSSGTGWIRTNRAYRAVVRGWPENALLACSGGVDSSALLALAGTAVLRGDLAPFIVVHVDHRTRPDSASESDDVVALGERFGLTTVPTAVLPAQMSGGGASPEESLRDLRYAALALVARQCGLVNVVTAHTRNDQVETVLMRLLKGASGLAAAGMLPESPIWTANGEIVIHRPLLAITRVELDDVLDRLSITPLVDPTNTDRSFRRNAVRHELIPVIGDAFPGFEEALLRTVTLAAQDASALDAIARGAYEQHVTIVEPEQALSISRAFVRSADPALSSRVIRWAAGQLMPDNQRELTFERVESIRAAADGRSGAVIELPYDVIARIDREQIQIERRKKPGDQHDAS